MALSNKKHISIMWWNVNNFYHFRQEEVGSLASRWPQTHAAYLAKLERVVTAFNEIILLTGKPDIIFLGEVTAESAKAIRDRVFPGYRLSSLDVKRDAPTLQVAIIYTDDCESTSFVEQPPITVVATPRGTRPMAVLDIRMSDSTVRIVGCHWQSRFDELGSEQTRFRLADHLAMYSYDFLNEKPGSNHIAVLGDLNEEPFERSLLALYAHRNRYRSKAKTHWADHDSKRAHLYNTSWRLLGEKYPHRGKSLDDCAGTYYWESERTWHHFDHLIVSGGLLQATTPFLDEEQVHIVSSNALLTDGLPIKFSSKNGVYRGLSDHLPLVARINI